MKFTWSKHRLKFKTLSGTSRGVLNHKDSWLIQMKRGGKTGIGECSIIEGLSPESPENVEDILEEISRYIHKGKDFLLKRYNSSPAMQFALEMAFSGLDSSHPLLHFNTAFVYDQQMIPINGLIWMSDVESMMTQLNQKLNLGFSCIKIKVGALDFASECKLLASIRKRYYDTDVELRVDANGAFQTNEVMQKLEQLSKYNIHSIEQPIAPGQWDEMAAICNQSPIPIALDEELIGVHFENSKADLLQHIKPQYIILKPSLVGGWQGADQWISIAEKQSIGWWATSALESNIGLNAIAQWLSTKEVSMPQGLGTGGLFTNNIDTPLYIRGQHLGFDRFKLQHFNLK
ncbi:o-succinylbenzoate synthase [Flavobacteriaceae bacterium]|nr:o-succinylbenzoate synthase [Flavobacteriaceae bacterium]